MKAFEEVGIVQTLCQYADRGITISHRLCDTVAISVHGMDAERRKKLPFEKAELKF